MNAKILTKREQTLQLSNSFQAINMILKSQFQRENKIIFPQPIVKNFHIKWLNSYKTNIKSPKISRLLKNQQKNQSSTEVKFQNKIKIQSMKTEEHQQNTNIKKQP